MTNTGTYSAATDRRIEALDNLFVYFKFLWEAIHLLYKIN